MVERDFGAGANFVSFVTLTDLDPAGGDVGQPFVLGIEFVDALRCSPCPRHVRASAIRAVGFRSLV